MTKIRLTIVFLLLSLPLAAITAAQTDPQAVEIPAADGLILVGDYYALPDIQAPTVLLLHELGASRNNWTELAEPLLEAGYNVLLVDLRGHGETGGERDWEAAVGDVQIWLDWLREQPGVQANGISIIGADFGGNLALISCGNDPECVTAIVFSPMVIGCDSRDCSAEIESVGEDAVEYLEEMTVQALSDTARHPSAMLVASQNDSSSIESIEQMNALLSDHIVADIWGGRRHGMELLSASTVSMITSVIQWLDGRTPANQTPAAIEALAAAGNPSNGETLFAEGRTTVTGSIMFACNQCHYMDSEETLRGPGLLNIGERAATRVEGQSAEVYLYNSIVAPDSYLVDPFSRSDVQTVLMLVEYDKVFTAEQIADLVAYLLTLEG